MVGKYESWARYRRILLGEFTAHVVSTRLAIFACPAFVIKHVCSYISIHFSVEIAEISCAVTIMAQGRPGAKEGGRRARSATAFR
jgi:hypothetical protein